MDCYSSCGYPIFSTWVVKPTITSPGYVPGILIRSQLTTYPWVYLGGSSLSYGDVSGLEKGRPQLISTQIQIWGLHMSYILDISYAFRKNVSDIYCLFLQKEQKGAVTD